MPIQLGTTSTIDLRDGVDGRDKHGHDGKKFKLIVMAGLDPAIHAPERKNIRHLRVDTRVTPGLDPGAAHEENNFTFWSWPSPRAEARTFEWRDLHD